MHITDDPSCKCGHIIEDTEHYILYCPLFNRERCETLNKLPQHFVNIKTLLYGNSTYDYDTNVKIFSTLENFLTLNKRCD